MKTKLLLSLSCLSFLATGIISAMEAEKDWYVTLGTVTNNSTATVSVKITKPGFSFAETQIIRPRSSGEFSTVRFASLVPKKAIINKLEPKTYIDITVNTGENKSVQDEILIEKRRFDNRDRIDVTINEDYNITYQLKRSPETQS